MRKRAVALDCLLFGCLEKMGEMNCCIGKPLIQEFMLDNFFFWKSLTIEFIFVMNLFDVQGLVRKSF